MAKYFMDFINKTDRVWTMSMYQTLPSSTGLDSVSWLQAAAPPGGSTGVEFEIKYNVAVANYAQDNGIGVYKASQILDADLGTSWEIVFEDGVQQLKAVGTAPQKDQLLITNKSGRIANPGIGMSGSGAVFKNGVNSGAAAQFQVTPTYYIGLFNNVVKGEVISSNVIVGPKKIVYPSGETRGTATATLDGSTIVLSVSYGDTVFATREEIDIRQEFVDFRRNRAGKSR